VGDHGDDVFHPWVWSWYHSVESSSCPVKFIIGCTSILQSNSPQFLHSAFIVSDATPGCIWPSFAKNKFHPGKIDPWEWLRSVRAV
jgi:hypothetical protein